METVATPLMWFVFAVLVLAALAVDLFVLKQSGPHRVRTREALLWSMAWIALAMLFNYGLWVWLRDDMAAADADRVALEFLTGYLVEKALAVDNIFVFLMLFTFFKVPAERQQRVLIFGVIGAIVLRAIMILIGAALIAQFHWILYLFGIFLAATGVKMLLFAGEPPHLERNPVLLWMNRHLRLTTEYHADSMTIQRDGVRYFTPLFLVMVMIGVTDVIFAVDSIPAIFAVTEDPFIVLTSNVFAVLGLRALYFLLAGMADRFHLLQYGLAAVLIFIGTKMLIVDFYKIPIFVALAVVAVTIGLSMVGSLLLPPKGDEPQTPSS